ncbi:MAG: DUF4915 domain-containing protein [Cyanobacteria bacterium HKST-UBA02]|nr:DUF4915 domain-containing protein [Cyanobacteria bacterium HKST-UBA02]
MTDLTATTSQTPSADALESIWSRHHAQWRDPAQVTSHWEQAGKTDPGLLEFQADSNLFALLERLDITLLITREYEHLLMALSVVDGSPLITYFNMPHPSGLAVDREKGIIYVASTRNPNQVFELMPVRDRLSRLDIDNKMENSENTVTGALLPVASRFYAGCFYMHDLAVIDGGLFANSVGQNAIVELEPRGCSRKVWWPACIEHDGEPIFGRNHIQLNSIAPGASIETSFFSASSTAVEELRPGDPDYPVDGRGVIFDGKTREVIVEGLTRPHSARLYNDRIYVDNSGYGELGAADSGRLEVIARLPGWTRGLSITGGIAFVGTSRVIPRFSQYAPGLDVNKSVCGIHAVDLESGDILGSLTWPRGNQIFAIEWLPGSLSRGFPFADKRREEEEKLLFYTYITETENTERSSR